MVDKSSVVLLYEAAEILGFEAREGWPAELPLKDVVSLFVGYRAVFPLASPRPIKVIDAYGSEVREFAGFDHALYEHGTVTEHRRKECGIVVKMLCDAGLRERIERRVTIIDKPPERRLCLIDGKFSTKEVAVPPDEKVDFVISRESMRFCLDGLGLRPPPHLAAWLDGDAASEMNDRSAIAVSDAGESTAVPDAWVQGIRRVAWDAAKSIVQDGKKLTANGLEQAMQNSEKVELKGDSYCLKSTDASLNDRQMKASPKTIAGWVTTLKKLLNK